VVSFLGHGCIYVFKYANLLSCTQHKCLITLNYNVYIHEDFHKEHIRTLQNLHYDLSKGFHLNASHVVECSLTYGSLSSFSSIGGSSVGTATTGTSKGSGAKSACVAFVSLVGFWRMESAEEGEGVLITGGGDGTGVTSGVAMLPPDGCVN